MHAVPGGGAVQGGPATGQQRSAPGGQAGKERKEELLGSRGEEGPLRGFEGQLFWRKGGTQIERVACALHIVQQPTLSSGPASSPAHALRAAKHTAPPPTQLKRQPLAKLAHRLWGPIGICVMPACPTVSHPRPAHPADLSYPPHARLYHSPRPSPAHPYSLNEAARLQPGPCTHPLPLLLSPSPALLSG